MLREIVEANHYMTLATADQEGRPWASPVWFAHAGYREFLWISRPGARHSRNIAARAEVGIVIFDSTVPPLQGQAVYIEGVAEELTGVERERGVEIYSRASEAAGIEPFELPDVTSPAPHRLYRARAGAHFVLDDHDERVPVQP